MTGEPVLASALTWTSTRESPRAARDLASLAFWSAVSWMFTNTPLQAPSRVTVAVIPIRLPPSSSRMVSIGSSFVPTSGPDSGMMSSLPSPRLGRMTRSPFQSQKVSQAFSSAIFTACSQRGDAASETNEARTLLVLAEGWASRPYDLFGIAAFTIA